VGIIVVYLSAKLILFMNTFYVFIIGILGSVITWYILRYLKKARIVLKLKPETFAIVPGSCTPSIIVKLTNVGSTKTEVDDIFFEFKNGSEVEKGYDDNYNKEVIWPIEPNNTKRQMLYCSDIFKKKLHEDFKIIRVVVTTTSDQAFRSKWIDCNEFKKVWDEGVKRAESRRYQLEGVK